jgi:hypothetical protein
MQSQSKKKQAALAFATLLLGASDVSERMWPIDRTSLNAQRNHQTADNNRINLQPSKRIRYPSKI